MTTPNYQDGTYRALHPRWHSERASWKAKQVTDGLHEWGITPTSIFDIGCGTGDVLRIVTERMGTVTIAVGYEPSIDAPIREGTLESVRVVRSLDDLRKEGPYDVALVLDVFEHIPDYVEFLRSIAHVANRFVFHIPLEINVLTVLTGRLGRSRLSLGHLHHFSKRTAEQALEGAGYSVADAHYTKSAWEGEGRRPRRALNLARRAIYQVSPTATERILGGLALLVLATSKHRPRKQASHCNRVSCSPSSRSPSGLGLLRAVASRSTSTLAHRYCDVLRAALEAAGVAFIEQNGAGS